MISINLMDKIESELNDLEEILTPLNQSQKDWHFERMWNLLQLAIDEMHRENNAEMRRNKTLESSSPELLGACRSILETWQTSPKSHQSHWSNSVNKACFAIRKAEGREA